MDACGPAEQVCFVEHERCENPRGGWTPGTPPATWGPGALPVTFTPALPLPRGLGQSALAELAVAARTWGEIACTSFRAATTAPASLTPGDDGVNGIFFHEDVWPPDLLPHALGQTIIHTDPNGRLRDTDIHLNGVEYTWSLGMDPSDAAVDLRGVALHEMGHALGLGHSAEPRATMHASHPPGLVWRSLAEDDRDGVCALYPGTGAARCDAGSACPEGFFCVARTCVRKGARGEVCSPCTRIPGACDGVGDDARCNDLPGAGQVCGRACTGDADCGPRLHCAPQTAAGDLQCVPEDACASGPNPCAGDHDCGSDARCSGGACVGGSVAATDAGQPVEAGYVQNTITAGGGCSLGGRSTGAPFALFWLALFATRKCRRQSLIRYDAALAEAAELFFF